MANEPTSVCMFPDLGHGHSHAREEVVAIDMPKIPIREVTRWCTDSGLDPIYLFSLGWGVILRHFADVDNVLIGVSTAGTTSTARTLSTSLSGRTVESLLVSEGWTVANKQSLAVGGYNTGIKLDDLASGNDTSLDITILIDILQSVVRMEYRTSFLSQPHAESVVEAFTQAIWSILKDPKQKVVEINVVGDFHTRQVSYWNSQMPRAARDHALYGLVSQHGSDELALDAWDGAISYGQLKAFCETLASYLQGKGVGPRSMVPICFEKSCWAVVAMLAVNKLGACFVPIDPSLPSDRIRTIVQKTKPQVAVTSQSQSHILLEIVPTSVVVTAVMLSSLTPADTSYTSCHLPTDPAYCLFTSGTTGTPKGCVVSHAAFSSVSTHCKALQIQPRSRVLQFASYAFGISLIEVFCTLSVGATVCIPSDQDRLNNLAQFMTHNRVNLAMLTPTVLNSIHPHQVPRLETLIVAGELMTTSHVRNWAEDVRLFQALGLTEWAGILCVSRQIRVVADRSNIGKPTNGVVWLADVQDINRLAPIGAPGEMVIEGPSMADGYHDDNERTGARFMTAPPWLAAFSPEIANRRLYRTGDIGHYNPDGSITYIGRKDTQVKVRGQRVELGEVENHITRCLPEGYRAVADIIEPVNVGPGRHYLAAFIVLPPSMQEDKDDSLCNVWATRASNPLSSHIDQVKDSIRSALPGHNLPDFFIPLRHLPVTITGKIDRRRLREIASGFTTKELDELTAQDGQKAISRPQGRKEAIIHRLIVDLLHLVPDQVGMEASFGRLGGDSVAAMKLVGRTRKEGGLRLTVAAILESQTLSDIALAAVEMTTASAQPISMRPFELLHEDVSEAVKMEASDTCQLHIEQIEDIYPCTPLQEGLIAMSMKTPGFYIAQAVYELHPSTDVARLQQAWEQTCQANAILRTRIIDIQSRGLFQVVLTCGDTSWETNQGFTRYKPMSPVLGSPLSQVQIVQEGSSTLFVLTIHHAICDRWSIHLLIEQLGRAFTGEKLPKQGFSQFIQHIGRVQDLETFWRSEVADIRSTQLFPDLPSPGYAVVPDQQLSFSIQTPSAADEELSLSTHIRLAWALALMSCTNCTTSVYGITLSGRNAPVPGIEQMAAPTIATVPLVTRLDRVQTVRDALKMVHKQSIRMIPYEQAGLQNIRRLSSDGEHACRFQTHLVVQPALADEPTGRFQARQQGSTIMGGFATYALELECFLSRDNSGFEMIATFDPSVISSNMVTLLCQSFQHNLQQTRLHPELTLDLLFKTLCPQHLQQLQNWNNSSYPALSSTTVHGAIDKRCSEQPHRPAVSSWDGELTYKQLNSLATIWAARLSRCGVKRGMKIPLCFHKSKWAPVAMLAVLKTGGSICYIDPSLPLLRIRSMCEDIGASVIVSSRSNEGLSESLSDQVVVIPQDDTQEDYKDLDLSHWRCPDVFSNDPLYTAFTSGSTGRPKGVTIEHGMYLASALAHAELIGIRPNSRALHFCSYSFDVSYLEQFSVLIAGACICIPTEEERQSNLAHAMARLNVDWAMLTPSVARVLSPRETVGLKTLVLIGEPVSASDVETWSDSVRLINTYGPAECSVVSSIRAPVRRDIHPSNIGYPCCSHWVVDPRNADRLMPIGAIGELLIEGPIVGTGYINAPEKSADAFIEPPSWLQSLRLDVPTRVYKTGDLVRYDPSGDGSLCFIGRKDNQVKLHGQRLELGDVEGHLRDCFPNARDIVAELIKPNHSSSTGPYLAAFVHHRDAHEGEGKLLAPPNASFHRDVESAMVTLRQRLPSFMIPHIFLPVKQIPRTTNGKVSRRELQMALASLPSTTLEPYRSDRKPKSAPSTSREEALRRIWAVHVSMQPEQIGVDDNVFHLGADSITAMHVVTAARQEKLQLTVADIFRYPNIREMSLRLQAFCDDTSSVPPPLSLLLENDEPVDNILASCAQECQIHQDDIEDVYSCTPLQDALFVGAAVGQRRKNRPTYVAQWEYSLHQNINRDQLQEAWEYIYRANPVLRTRFVQLAGGSLYQVVVREAGRWETWCGRDEYSQALGSMVLGQPLVRLAWVQDGKTQKLVLTMHHAVYDAWSIPQLWSQVENAYHNRTAPVVPTPFASFVRYVRSGQNIEASRDFWVSQFADLEAVVFPSMSLGSYEPSATKDLQKMVQLGQSTSHEFTQSTLIRLAWAFVQSQYQCTSDVVFGVTLSGRHAPIPGIEAMTGPTIATIPWRAIVHSNRPIRELLEQVQRQASEIIPHEQMGIHNIRKMSSYAERACSFQTLLVVQTGTNSSSMASTILDGVESTVGACDFCTHSLTIVCNLVQGGIQIQMLFDPTIISGSRVGNILGQFAYILQLLHDSNTNFERRLQDFPLISPQDISVLNHWNRDLPATVNHCAHELFRKRCFEAPNAPAVSAWDGKWTYSELDVTSSALAKALVQQGVEREMFVPVCMAKSRWVIAAMLAILKAGAAFVLLDPTHPVQRLQTICESIGAEVVVTSHQYLGLGKSLAPQCFVLDEQQLSSLGNISHDDFPALSPSSAIYAVFTSGSTGTPKGVVIEHRSFCSAALAYLPQLGIAPGARVLHFASYAFDVSIMETLATLVGGGCICILSDSQRLNGFCEAATSLGVTHALLPPSLIRSLSPSELRTIKTLVLGGEKMAAADIDNWSREVRLINAYGPAECAINTLLRANITASVDAANLGFGTGVVCWVTDPDNVEQLVPLGGVGELILEGPAVGRGYLKDLEKTAAAFIDTPSWLLTLRGNHPGRLYRTGDLVRYVDDGSLVYVGRKDSQVKLRGQRIDLGEVESYLRHNFNAQDVAAEVIIPQFLPSAPLLAAFVLFAADARKGDRESLSVLGNPNATFHQEVEAATTKLHQLLPKYMIPTRYFPLNRMPRLPSGKIDRRCLQQSVAILSAAEMEQFQPMASEKRDPSTNAERILQRIWAEVLSQPLDKIGVDDSFFHLGGDSIGVMKMAAMAREQGVQISVADVFAQPELNSLAFSSQSQSALAISQPRRWEPFSLSGVNDLHAFSKRLSAQGIVLADPDEIEDIIPVSESQSLFLRRDVLHYFSFVLEGCLDISRLQAALRAVTNKYSILRTCFIPQGHSYLQIVRRSIPLPFTHVVGHADIMNTCSDIWKKDSATWNVVREVPFQLILVSESASPTRHALLIRLLHAQWDGVSLPYLFRDIEEAYKGHTIRPVSSFGDFLYAREIKKSAATFSFWREFLHGASMVTLPSSLKCPKTPADDPATVWVMKELQSPRSPPPGITMATVVKAAFSLVMSNLIKQTDFVFGQTVNSRSFSLDDIDKILGPCLNLIPFRIQLEDGWKVKDLLDHVQQQHTLTMAHDYLDFGDIVDKCTDWSPETKFSCILQHQNIERNHHLALDESIRSDFKLFPRFRPLSELWIFSVPEASSLAIEVCTRSCTLSQESATLLAEVLCMAVEQLLRCPNGSMCDSVLAIQAKMLNFPTYFSTQR